MVDSYYLLLRAQLAVDELKKKKHLQIFENLGNRDDLLGDLDILSAGRVNSLPCAYPQSSTTGRRF